MDSGKNHKHLRIGAEKVLTLLEKKGQDSDLARLLEDEYMPYETLKGLLKGEIAKKDEKMDYDFFSEVLGFFQDNHISIDAPIPRISITDQFHQQKAIPQLIKLYKQGVSVGSELNLPEEVYDVIAKCTSDYSMHLGKHTVLFDPSKHKLSLHKDGASTDSSKDVYQGEEVNFIAKAYSCITVTLIETAERAKEKGDESVFITCGVLYKYFTSLSSENCNQGNAMDFAKLLKLAHNSNMEFREISAELEYNLHDQNSELEGSKQTGEDKSLLKKNNLDSKTHHANPHLRGSDQNTVGSFIEEGGVDLSGVNAVEAPVEVA